MRQKALLVSIYGNYQCPCALSDWLGNPWGEKWMQIDRVFTFWYKREGKRAESTSGRQTALESLNDYFTAVQNLWFNTALQAANSASNNQSTPNRIVWRKRKIFQIFLVNSIISSCSTKQLSNVHLTKHLTGRSHFSIRQKILFLHLVTSSINLKRQITVLFFYLFN